MERVLVTGVTSGIGKEIARYLSEQGYKVIGTYHFKNTNELKNVAYEYLDVNDVSSLEAIIKKYGYFDVVVMNAGILYSGRIEELEDKKIDDLISTNLTSPIKMTKRLVNMFQKTKKGKLIFISSLASRRGLPTLSVYNASKAGLNGFVESLYLELAKYKINCYLIEPGYYKTNLWKDKIPALASKRSIKEVAIEVEKIIKGKSGKLHHTFGISSKLQLMSKPLIYSQAGRFIYSKLIDRK